MALIRSAQIRDRNPLQKTSMCHPIFTKNKRQRVAMSKLAERPRWNGLVVPWVTRWSDEVRDEAFSCAFDSKTGRSYVHYPDETLNDRDAYGVLWQREGSSQTGEPQFATLSAFRQRLAMRATRCQVCGVRLPKENLLWLMAEGHMGILKLTSDITGEHLTQNPPICEGCVVMARRLCPHLRSRGSTLLRVEKYEEVGIFGEQAWFEGKQLRRGQQIIRHGEAMMKSTIAKQVVVDLIGVTEVETLDKSR